ncbi:MAG: hypothetical protein ACKVJ7_03595 [Candidatus Poseidoniales archaeon]|jgi:ATP synthase H subunit
MAMIDVLKSIKEAETAANETLAASKEEAIQIVAGARRKATEIVQDATDGSLTSTLSVLNTARDKAGKEAKTVQSDGSGAIEAVHSSASKSRDDAVQLIIDSLMP